MNIASRSPDEQQASITPHPDVERLLGALHAVQPAEGMEARVVLRLQAQVASNPASVRSRLSYRDAVRVAWTRAYALPAALALVCVFAGGWLTAHENAIAVDGRQGQLQAASLVTQQRSGPVRALPGVAPDTRLATASAQVRPARRVPAGRHRARAAHLVAAAE